MSDSKRGKKPLVADRRYPKRRSVAAAKKPAPVRRKSKRKPKKRRNILSRLLRWFMRLIWGLIWRVWMLCFVVLALAVGYVWTTLPDVNVLLDGRARGSVTLQDRDADAHPIEDFERFW